MHCDRVGNLESIDVMQDTRARMHRIICNYLESQNIQYQGAGFKKLEEIGIASLCMLGVMFKKGAEFGVQTGEIDNVSLENS